MNKRGVALVIAYMVVGVLVILSIGLISGSISEKNIVQRHINSSRAFWLAEAGIARAINAFPQSPLNGSLGPANHTYGTLTAPVAGSPNCFTITSTGTVTLSAGNTIDRTVRVIVRDPQFGAIADAITTTGTVKVKGAATVNGNIEENAVFSFANIFDMTEDQVKAQADHFYQDPPNDVEPVDGVTWIEMTPGEELVIARNDWSGSGILVVNGDLKITGGTFSGILWVTGSLVFAVGNPNFYGSIFVDCGVTITDVGGVASIDYDANAVQGALGNISPIVLSWQEL